MGFHVGQKVVCVSNKWPSLWLWLRSIIYPPVGDNPIVGRTYTVSKVHPDGDIIEIHEVYSPATEHWEAGFLAYDFRPVIERTTDISIFLELLTPKQLERVD